MSWGIYFAQRTRQGSWVHYPKEIYFFWKKVSSKAQKVSKLYDKYFRNEKKNNGMHKHIFFAICCVIFLYANILFNGLM